MIWCSEVIKHVSKIIVVWQAFLALKNEFSDFAVQIRFLNFDITNLNQKSKSFQFRCACGEFAIVIL